MKKNVKGITLIALVVTIIVLLILAGVSIAVLTGENGIINRTTEAKKTTEEAEIMENIRLAFNNAQIGKYAGKNENFVDTMKSDLEKTYGTGESNVKVEDTENNTYRVTIKGKKYTIAANGNVTKVEGFDISSTSLNLQKRIGGTTAQTTITATKDGVEGTVNWALSQSEEVVSISGTTGDSIKVTPLKAGSATITVTCANKTKQCAITVVEVSKVTVTFNLNGGSVDNSTENITRQEFPGDTIDTLPEPTKENYTFGGWYENDQFTGSALTTITVPSSDKIYYAKWTQTGYGAIGTPVLLNNGNDITITFGANDTATIPDDWKVFYEDEYNVYLIYGHYYPANAQIETTTGSTIFAPAHKSDGTDSSNTYSVNSRTDRTTLLRYLRNNNAYSWNDTSPYGDVDGANGEEYTSWSKLKTALSGLTSLSGKTIKVQGSPDIELWVKSWEAKGNTDLKVTKEQNGYNIMGANENSNSKYYINVNTSPYNTTASSTNQTGYYDELYFPYRDSHTTGYGYWLASPGANFGDSMCRVTCSGNVNCSYYYSDASYCARPVVSIAK